MSTRMIPGTSRRYVAQHRAVKPATGPDLFYPALAVFAATAFWVLALDTNETVMLRALGVSCVLVSMLAVWDATSRVWTARSGLVAAAMFGFSAPVMFLGSSSIETVILALLAVAMSLALAHRTLHTAAIAGLLLAAAVIMKPTLEILLIAFVAMAVLSPSRDYIARGAAVASAALLALTTTPFWAENTFVSDIHERTFYEASRNPIATAGVVDTTVQSIIPIVAAATVGLVFVILRKRVNELVVALLLIGVAVLVPMSHLVVGDYSRFQEQLAYSSLFLAPLAGWGLARPWRSPLWAPVITFLFLGVFIWGVIRSHDMLVLIT